jgi:hypothetical protein
MEQIHKITQAYNQTPWRKQVRLIGIFLLVVVVVAIVASVYLDVRARTNALGRELQWMQVQLEDYNAITGIDPTPTPTPTPSPTGPDDETEEDDDIIPIEVLERNIALLRTQLAFLTSYQTMAQRADDMGLVQAGPDDIVYLEIEGYVDPPSVELAPSLQPEVGSIPEIDPAYQESLFDWLDDQIAQIMKLFNGVKP